MATNQSNSFIFIGLVDKSSDVKRIAKKICQQFDKSYKIDGVLEDVSVAIGISICYDYDNTVPDLLYQANAAMQQINPSDKEKNNYQFYSV